MKKNVVIALLSLFLSLTGLCQSADLLFKDLLASPQITSIFMTGDAALSIPNVSTDTTLMNFFKSLESMKIISVLPSSNGIDFDQLTKGKIGGINDPKSLADYGIWLLLPQKEFYRNVILDSKSKIALFCNESSTSAPEYVFVSDDAILILIGKAKLRNKSELMASLVKAFGISKVQDIKTAQESKSPIYSALPTYRGKGLDEFEREFSKQILKWRRKNHKTANDTINIVVRFTVDKFGLIKDVKVIGGFPSIDSWIDRTLEGTYGWRPACIDGKPTEMRMQIAGNHRFY